MTNLVGALNRMEIYNFLLCDSVVIPGFLPL
jgi:hypothetical protein